MKITPDAHKDTIEAYTIDLWSMQEIADVLHVSRHAVWKFLKRMGVDTTKRVPCFPSLCPAIISSIGEFKCILYHFDMPDISLETDGHDIESRLHVTAVMGFHIGESDL